MAHDFDGDDPEGEMAHDFDGDDPEGEMVHDFDGDDPEGDTSLDINWLHFTLLEGERAIHLHNPFECMFASTTPANAQSALLGRPTVEESEGSHSVSWVLDTLAICDTTYILSAVLFDTHGVEDVVPRVASLYSACMSKGELGGGLSDHSIAVRATRHPLQVARLRRGGAEKPPERWTFHEVVEHFIAVYPTCWELYRVLWDWLFTHTSYGSMDEHTLVLPATQTRQRMEGRSECDRVEIVPSQMWSILVEHAWGNSSVLKAVGDGMRLRLDSAAVNEALDDIDFTLLVHLPAEACEIHPIGLHVLKEDGEGVIVSLSTIDIRWMAARMAPFLLSHTIALVREMFATEVLRTYHAARAQDGGEIGTDIYIASRPRGIACTVRLVISHESLIFDLQDIVLMSLDFGVHTELITLLTDYYSWKHSHAMLLGKIVTEAIEFGSASPSFAALFELHFGAVHSWGWGDDVEKEIRSLICSPFITNDKSPITLDTLEAEYQELSLAIRCRLGAVTTHLQRSELNKKMAHFKIFLISAKSNCGELCLFAPCTLVPPVRVAGVTRSTVTSVITAIAESDALARVRGYSFFAEFIGVPTMSDELWPAHCGDNIYEEEEPYPLRIMRLRELEDGSREVLGHLFFALPFVVDPRHNEPAEHQLLASCKYQRSPIDGTVVTRTAAVREASLESRHPQVLLVQTSEIVKVLIAYKTVGLGGGESNF